jgi:DNA-binding beta-propeller fold protein YncE
MVGGLTVGVGTRPNDIAFSRDGSRFFATVDGSVQVFDTASRALLATWPVGTELGALSLSPDGSFLLVTERQPLSFVPSSEAWWYDRSVVTTYKIDTATGAAISMPVQTTGSYGAFFDVAVLADGTALLTQSLINATGSSNLVWRLDIAAGNYTQLQDPYIGEDSPISSTGDGSSALIAVSWTSGPLYRFQAGASTFAQSDLYENGYIASGGKADPVQAISAEAGLAVQAFGNYDQVSTANRILVRDLALNLVVDLNTRIPELGPLSVNGLAFSGAGDHLFVLDGAANQIVSIAVGNWSIDGRFDIGASVNDPDVSFTDSEFGNRLVVSPDGMTFLVVTEDGIRYVRDNAGSDSFAGTNGDDRLWGGPANDVLFGLAGDDLLSGDAGNDTLYGSEGSDVLIGGADLDQLTGGKGSDFFRGTRSELNGDTITDLGVWDRLEVTDAPYASFTYARESGSLSFGGTQVSLGGAVNLRLVPVANGGGTDLVAVNRFTALNDFSGDGHSDLLWQHPSGYISTWDIAGNVRGDQIQANSYLNRVDPGWTAAETLDFNGDGRSDILWRHDGGALSIWTASGSVFSGSYFDGSVGNDWRIAAVGDANGDARDDILWQHGSGAISLWQSTGTGYRGTYLNNDAGLAGWKVAGMADFNGDGRDDIMWRHEGGAMSTWQSTGNGFVGTYFYQGVDNSWHIDGLADFNGDGSDDIVWRQDGGAISVWQTNGNGFIGNTYFDPSVTADWQIEQTGDFDNDGKSDLLWRHTGGTFATWESTGNGFEGVLSSSSVGTDWQIQAHDFQFG